jgi:Protein of unknown function (DUF2934)
MSAKPKRHGSTEPQAAFADPETCAVSVVNPPREEAIKRRAYEIYLERGEQPGHELEDWLQAEREFKGVMVLHAQAS